MNKEANGELRSPLGLTSMQIAREARDLYLKLMTTSSSSPASDDKKLPHWSAWVDGMMQAIQLQRPISVTTAAKGLTARLDVSFDKQPLLVKLVWQAVVRHAANLMQAGQQAEDGFLDSMEERRNELTRARSYDWREWIVRKYEESQGAPRS